MRHYGPLKFMTCMRFEGKHKQIKESSKISKSRKNPAFTLALRHQLHLCYKYLRNEFFVNGITVGNIISKLHSIDHYEVFRDALPSDVLNNYDCVKWIEIYGTKYDNNSIICISNKDISPMFGEIKHIIISPTSSVFFLYTKMNTLYYNRHVSAFQVEKTRNWSCISYNDLEDCSAYYIQTMTDNTIFPRISEIKCILYVYF